MKIFFLQSLDNFSTEAALLAHWWSSQAGDLDPDWHVHRKPADTRGPAFLDQRPNKGHEESDDPQPEQPGMASEADHRRGAMERAGVIHRRATTVETV